MKILDKVLKDEKIKYDRNWINKNCNNAKHCGKY